MFIYWDTFQELFTKFKNVNLLGSDVQYLWVLEAVYTSTVQRNDRVTSLAIIKSCCKWCVEPTTTQITIVDSYNNNFLNIRELEQMGVDETAQVSKRYKTIQTRHDRERDSLTISTSCHDIAVLPSLTRSQLICVQLGPELYLHRWWLVFEAGADYTDNYQWCLLYDTIIFVN